MSSASKRVAVVGLGRLGTCLVRALRRSGIEITALVDRDPDRVTQLTHALELPSAVVTHLERVPAIADWVFITVPDSELSAVSEQLALGAGHALVHCSGALDLTPISAAGARGAALAVFHPLQSFPPNASAERFSGVAIGIDAGAPLFDELSALAAGLGARAFSLRGVDRARYHAAAVFASNYLVALHAIAARVWQSAGLPAESARAALATLSRGTVENIERHELAVALTGPIARADAVTVARHLAALEDDRLSLEIYRVLACELLQLPLNHAQEARAALERVLEEPD